MGAMADPNSTNPGGSQGGGPSGLTPDQQAALAAAVMGGPASAQPMDSVLQSLLTPLYPSPNPGMSPADDATLSALFGNAPGSAQPTADAFQNLSGAIYPSGGDQTGLSFGDGSIGPPGLAPEHDAALTALFGNGPPVSAQAWSDPFQTLGGLAVPPSPTSGQNDGLADALVASGSRPGAQLVAYRSGGQGQSGVASFPHDWDPIVERDVAAYNKMNDAQPGDDVYLDPDLIKAMIMTESGHDQHAYDTDPMQVNKSTHDWDYYKANLGLVKGQPPGPALGIQAGLGWLDSKSYFNDAHGNPGPFLGYETAIKRYNANRNNPDYYDKVMGNYKLIKDSEK